MENNPKKSKAFIIAFILILLLLIGGYYLFKNRDGLFGSKGIISTNKIFAPLLGTSKNKPLVVINNNTTQTGEGTGAGTITGVVTTDEFGNKIVLAEAGEDLNKGDVLYISGFNKTNNPIVKKAIANDPLKSLVFGVANENMKKGSILKVMISGILNGMQTNRAEGTPWMANNPLYLSDKIFGGMTKNSPFPPSQIIPVGSVLKVDAINGSILIGDLLKNPNIPTFLGMRLPSWDSGVFRGGGTPIEKPVKPDPFDSFPACSNKKDDDKDGKIDEMDPQCHVGGDLSKPYVASHYSESTNAPAKEQCENEADNYPDCNKKGGICLNGLTTADCKEDPVPCVEGETNPPSNCITEEIKTTANKCLLIEQNPLTFTPEEKARLAVLLRKFYLVSSTLRTSEDITTIYNEIDQQKNFISQTKDLTTQCYAQITDNKLIDNKWVRHGNPWFPQKIFIGSFPYTDEGTGYIKDSNNIGNFVEGGTPTYNETERILNIW